MVFFEKEETFTLQQFIGIFGDNSAIFRCCIYYVVPCARPLPAVDIPLWAPPKFIDISWRVAHELKMKKKKKSLKYIKEIQST